VLRKHIFGGHVADYMKAMRDEDNAKFVRYFTGYAEAKIKPEDLEKKWTEVHKAIRANPVPKKVEKVKPKDQKRFRRAKMTLADRRNRIKQKIALKAKAQQ